MGSEIKPIQLSSSGLASRLQEKVFPRAAQRLRNAACVWIPGSRRLRWPAGGARGRRLLGKRGPIEQFVVQSYGGTKDGLLLHTQQDGGIVQREVGDRQQCPAASDMNELLLTLSGGRRRVRSAAARAG